MAGVHPWNMLPKVRDHAPNLDHVDEHPRNQDFEEKTSDASAIPLGGGGRRVGGHVKCSFGCCDEHEPDYLARECLLPGPSYYAPRGNQADVKGFTFGTATFRSKPLNTSTEITTDSEPVPSFLDDFPSGNVDDIRLLLAKNEEMILSMKKLQADLEICRKDLSSARNKEAEMTMRWSYVKSQYEETKYQLYEKMNELDETTENADLEIMKLKLETKQWRKATKAIASVVLAGGAEICSMAPELQPLVLYYSNRATKRMSVGKMRKAIDDCGMAARLDPSFDLKACLTVGNCHLALGETDDAWYNYKKCLESGMVCLDRRLTIEASDGLQNVEKVVNYINKSAELLQQKTLESVNNALEVITEALSISCYSEKLLEMKGEALFMLQKYEEVVQMCEKTLALAEKNCAMSDEEQKRPLKLWRWSLMSRSYFHMANFDLAYAILRKYQQLAPAETKTEGPSLPSVAIVSELIQCKNAGNEAYEAGRYREAVEHYSNALLRSVESRSFTAICFCNRAAAHQALGEVVDAIADCNLAIALDGNYLKAISRRASLYEKIRAYENAAFDLQRLISLLEKRSEAKDVEDLTEARQRLSSVNRYMKKRTALDLYLILGLKGSESDSEIRKAYRKAALRHHPDKAGKFLARSESGADGYVWKEIFTTIHKDADQLFKIIGEAYAVLSDTEKRFKYNLEDAMPDDFGW